MLVTATGFTLMTLCAGSKAKLSGAEMVAPEVVQVEVSSSAMKASLKGEPTNSGYSSERKRKLIDRQLAPPGTSRSILNMETSWSVSPRTEVPPSLADVLGAVFGASAQAALPVVRMANVPPLTGNPARGELPMPCGVPWGGIVVKAAPVTIAGLSAMD